MAIAGTQALSNAFAANLLVDAVARNSTLEFLISFGLYLLKAQAWCWDLRLRVGVIGQRICR